MKIMIDTKNDSAADIRKVIALLSKLIEDSPLHNPNIFEDNSSSAINPASGGSVLANLFGDSNSNAAPLTSTVVEEKKEDGDIPQIMTY